MHGIVHGISSMWHKNGVLKQQETRDNDVLHGPYTRWDESGYLQLTTNYVNGRLHGLYRSYDNGACCILQFYDNIVRELLSIVDDKGRDHSVESMQVK